MKKAVTKKPTALEKVRSQLKKAEHAHTPSSIKQRLKKARAPKAKPREQK